MNFKILFPILLSVVMVLVGCSSGTSTANKPKASTAQTKKVDTKNAQKSVHQQYWSKVQTEVGIPDVMAKKIQGVNLKFEKRIAELMKAKKWNGPANANTRKQITAQKQNDLKPILGNKLAAFNKFNDRWTAKQKK